MRASLCIALCLIAAPALAQEKLSGTNVDTRLGFAFKAPDAAVQKMIPAGWELNVPTSGPNRGANLNLSVVDQMTSQDAEGKALTPYRGVAVTIPVKRKGSADGGPMVVAGRRQQIPLDRKSTRLNSSHGYISYAVFCLKKKKKRV